MKNRNFLTKLDRTRFRSHCRLATAVSLVAAGVVSAILTLPLTSTGGSAPPAEPQVISYGQMQARTTTIDGAQVLPTTRTVTHWFGSTLDPNNGVTYAYNMVGADPNNCSGADCDVTVTADIIPLNVIVDGESFNGSDAVDATLASPVFALNDYGSTPFATVPGAFPDEPFFVRGPGGVLSQNDAGNQLQLQDATMRAQFNKTGSSSYHLRLNPVVHEAITIVVPSGQGLVLQSPNGGVHGAFIEIQWWSALAKNLNASLGYVDPTHLPLYLTHDVLLFFHDLSNCCVLGFHGASKGARNGNGNQPVQTFAWASYFSPGGFDRPNGGTDWALTDIHVLTHEIAEWADDPFINNLVEPWSTPTAPSYGCVGNLETGDPVVGIGFAMGTNIYFQGPNPDGTQTADGYYHPEDEVFLPWFMRLALNNISEPTQSPSPNVGRYTLMGDLNLFQSFHEPATSCN